MDELNLAAEQLVHLARPFLSRGDTDGLTEALRARWSADCIELLLEHPDEEIVHLALTCLGLVGDLAQCQSVSRLLQHNRSALVVAAENALWSIWFRAGGSEAGRLVRKAAGLLEKHLPERALPLLDLAIRDRPMFAEAYHQRAIARLLLGRHDAALEDAKHASRLHPGHFAAWACQGNCYAETGQHAEALRCYRVALRIHPRSDMVRQLIRELRTRVRATRV
jgi:tetratricopeptide (TPR) repeat protein